MIEDPPVLRIKRNFQRPSTEQVAALSNIATGFIVDCMDGRGALHASIKPIDESQAFFCGVAVTCDCGPADNLAAFGGLDICQPGDVLVLATDAFEATAVIGDLVLGMAKNSGAVALVTDGYVRDLAGIKEVALPCFAAGITPNSPARNGPGTAGLPITMAGVNIQPGDIILGDPDGVVVVPYTKIEQVIGSLPAVLAAESELDARVKSGLKISDFARELLDSNRVIEED